MKSGDATQIAIWSLNLTSQGQASQGTVSVVLAPAASVTGASASSETMRLVI